ncbi:MAG: glycosyltransferase family 2 protein [Gemmatimonadaceae bacterium]
MTDGAGRGVAVVIPALEAASALGALLDRVQHVVPEATVIVVDDGSEDSTSAIAVAAGAVVIRFTHNRGKGAALRAGFLAARTRGASSIVTLDADGQHDPGAIPAMLSGLGAADVVIGARRASRSAMPWSRRVTNALATTACSTLAGCAVHDAQSGFRAFRSALLDRVAACGDRYEFETDFLIRAGRAGATIAAVDVPTIYGPKSHFREFADGALVIRTIVRHRLGHVA